MRVPSLAPKIVRGTEVDVRIRIEIRQATVEAHGGGRQVAAARDRVVDGQVPGGEPRGAVGLHDLIGAVLDEHMVARYWQNWPSGAIACRWNAAQ